MKQTDKLQNRRVQTLNYLLLTSLVGSLVQVCTYLWFHSRYLVILLLATNQVDVANFGRSCHDDVLETTQRSYAETSSVFVHFRVNSVRASSGTTRLYYLK